MQLKTYDAKVVNYTDLEDFLEELYGVRVDIQAGEYSNNSYLEFEVRDFETVEGFDLEKELNDWIKSGGPYFDEELIGLDLARKKLLPEGKYIITIWW